MKGKVLFIDAETGEGTISADDGKRYSFHQNEVKGGNNIAQGTEVDFVSEDGESAKDIYIVTSTTVNNTNSTANAYPEYVTCKPGGLFSWTGCYSRSKWWLVMVSIIFLSSILWLIEYYLVIDGYRSLATNIMNGDVASQAESWIDSKIGFSKYISSAISITWLVMAWISFVTSIKRFHDANLSGWMILISIIPFIGTFIVFIINGFVGSKPFGNMYCVQKDRLGRPIVKGSPEAEAFEQAAVKQAEVKETPKREKVKKPPMSAKTKKMITIAVAVLLIAAMPASYFAFFIHYTHYTTKDKSKSNSVVYKSYFSYMTNKVKDGAEFRTDYFGKPSFEGHYKNGKKDGLFKEWDNGKLTSEENYKDGKKDGVFKKWDSYDKKLTSEENYKDDKKDGLFKVWYYGQLTSEENYKDDKKDGVFKKWDDRNGKLESEENYKDDKKDGVSKWYNNDGTVNTEENYKDGKKNGMTKKWWNGKLESEENYKDDKKYGVSKKYNSHTGKIEKLSTYYNDVLEGPHQVWEKGVKIVEGQYSNGKAEGTWTYRYPDGRLSAQGEFYSGKESGQWKDCTIPPSGNYYCSKKFYSRW